MRVGTTGAFEGPEKDNGTRVVEFCGERDNTYLGKEHDR